MTNDSKELENIDNVHQAQMGELEVRCTELENLIKELKNTIIMDGMESFDDDIIDLLNKYLGILRRKKINNREMTQKEILMQKIEWVTNRIEYYCLGNLKFNDNAQDEFMRILKVLNK